MAGDVTMKIYTQIWIGSLLLLVLLIPAAVGAQPVEISIQYFTGTVGETVTIPIVASGAVNVGTMEFIVTYDPAVLTILSVESGSLSNGVLSTNLSNPGSIPIVLIDGQGFSGTGQIAVLSCIVTGAPGSSTALSLSEAAARDILTDGEIPVTTSDGAFTVENVPAVTQTPGFSYFLAILAVAGTLFVWRVRRTA